MKRLLVLAAVFGQVAALSAGVSPKDREDEGLLPGDFGKPVVVHLLPGLEHDPWMIDDPVIIIDRDGPSEDDEGLVYDFRGRLLSQPVEFRHRAGH
jgi:hypothetical protein